MTKREMTNKARMLAAMRGRLVPDALPWAPRMDLWYIAGRERGTLPPRFRGLTTAGIADALGVACHAVRADFTLPRDPRDFTLRGLGIENHADSPYRVEVDGLPVEFDHHDDVYRTTIHTPAGDVRTVLEHSDEMRRNGSFIPEVKERPIRSVADLEAVAQVFEHLAVIPTPAGYDSFRDRIGERGVAVANGPVAASPMHLILHDLMDMEAFFYLYLDDVSALRRLAERMTPFFDAQLEVLALSGAEVVWWGANYDQNVTWPDFFRREIVPWAAAVSDRLHASGKLLLTHADGENNKLLDDLPACQFDVAESVCTAPMTRRSLRELRLGMGTETTIWGGIPSVALLESSMDDETFRRHLGNTFAEIESDRRIILGVSDNVPPDASLDRLDAITAAAQGYRPLARGQRWDETGQFGETDV